MGIGGLHFVQDDNLTQLAPSAVQVDNSLQDDNLLLAEVQVEKLLGHRRC